MAAAQVDGRDSRQDSRAADTQGRSWRLPMALGMALLSVGGFFVLVAYGLSILASIGS